MIMINVTGIIALIVHKIILFVTSNKPGPTRVQNVFTRPRLGFRMFLPDPDPTTDRNCIFDSPGPIEPDKSRVGTGRYAG